MAEPDVENVWGVGCKQNHAGAPSVEDCSCYHSLPAYATREAKIASLACCMLLALLFLIILAF